MTAALEVDGTHEIDLVQLLGGPSLRARVVLTREQWGQADSWCGQALALQDTLDGTFAGQRVNPQRLQLGKDGQSARQAVAGSRDGVGLKPPADGKDGPFQFGRDTLGDMVVGPSQVVEAFGAGFQVTVPPLVEPSLDTPQSRADVLDGPAGEAETEGALRRRKLVVHDVLRSTAAGGCLRRTC